MLLLGHGISIIPRCSEYLYSCRRSKALVKADEKLASSEVSIWCSDSLNSRIFAAFACTNTSEKHSTTSFTSSEKVKMFTKSFAVNVSNIFSTFYNKTMEVKRSISGKIFLIILTTCRAMSLRCPVIDPELSIKITMSFGLFAA